MSIPKIVHLIEPAHNVLSVWQNSHPDWQCIEWSIEGCYAFLKRYYPDAEKYFLQLTTNSQRIHMAWYYLLHRYGGVVVEGNRVPKKKIEALFLSLYDLYFIEDWFIASAPNTPFLKEAIETLPTLQPKWYSRFLGEKALIRDTAMVLPDTPHKKHSYRVYNNYFHPLQPSRIGVWRILFIGMLVLLVFYLVRFAMKRQGGFFTSTDEASTTELPLDEASTTELPLDKDSPLSLVISPLSTTSNSSLSGTKGKGALSPSGGLVPPHIHIPPLNPPTPSSISGESLVITPFSNQELEITI